MNGGEAGSRLRSGWRTLSPTFRGFDGTPNIKARDLLCASCLVACMLSSLSGCDQSPLEAAPVELPRVLVHQIGQGSDKETLSLAAEIIATGTVDLAFEHAGRLELLEASEGSRVEAGQRLAQIDARQFELDVQQASAELQLAALEVKRLAAVHDRGMSSDAALDEARLKRDLAAVKLERAKEDLSRTELLAPFTAYISRRLVENHTHVEPGQPIVTLVPVAGREVRAYLPERLMGQLTQGELKEAMVSLHGAPEEQHSVVLREYSVQASNVTGAFEVRYELGDAAAETLLPGMTAILQLALPSTGKTLLRVPVDAVNTDAKGDFYVWLVEDSRVSRRSVIVSSLQNDWALVEDGLNAGNNVVIAGGQRLSAGQTVVPEQATSL